MAIFRGLFFVLLMASALFFAFYVGTGKLSYRRWGAVILKWTIFAGLAFFVVLGITRFMGW